MLRAACGDRPLVLDHCLCLSILILLIQKLQREERRRESTLLQELELLDVVELGEEGAVRGCGQVVLVAAQAELRAMQARAVALFPLRDRAAPAG